MPDFTDIMLAELAESQAVLDAAYLRILDTLSTITLPEMQIFVERYKQEAADEYKRQTDLNNQRYIELTEF